MWSWNPLKECFDVKKTHGFLNRTLTSLQAITTSALFWTWKDELHYIQIPFFSSIIGGKTQLN